MSANTMHYISVCNFERKSPIKNTGLYVASFFLMNNYAILEKDRVGHPICILVCRLGLTLCSQGPPKLHRLP